MKKKLFALALILSGLSGALFSLPALAEDDPTCVETSLFGTVCDKEGNGDGVFLILNVVLTVMTFGVGILGTLGIVIAGIQYSTARDNDQQMAKAKMRIVQIVIGLAVWSVLYVALEWLMPGGVFGN